MHVLPTHWDRAVIYVPRDGSVVTGSRSGGPEADITAADPHPARPRVRDQGELTRHLVLRALASDLPIAWVTADSPHRREWGFRPEVQAISGLVPARSPPCSRTRSSPR